VSAQVPSLSVVVPVYNSAGALPDLVKRLEPVLRASAREFELVLVNDGSRDNSWQTMLELRQQHSWIHAIDLMRNSGQHNALLCAIRSAKHDLIVTIDDDLQHPPEEIPKLLAALDPLTDVVYGAPEREAHGLMRDLASQVTKVVLQGVLGADTARMVGPFRLFRAHVRNAFAEYRGTFVNIDVLLTWGSTRFKAIRVRHDARLSGTSNYNFNALLTHTLNMLTGFSTLPLRLSSLLGFGLTVLGAFLLIYVLGRYLLQGVAVPGFAFLASIIIIFSGTQLFTLGVMGEYLARMHFRLLDRATYVIREQHGD
jgi:undecaprenyl-phosphate 4-deoxy-4-formamido-L-arabinose transferase